MHLLCIFMYRMCASSWLFVQGLFRILYLKMHKISCCSTTKFGKFHISNMKYVHILNWRILRFTVALKKICVSVWVYFHRHAPFFCCCVQPVREWERWTAEHKYSFTARDSLSKRFSLRKALVTAGRTTWSPGRLERAALKKYFAAKK